MRNPRSSHPSRFSPGLVALAVLPFYFLEILVGLVQALVFALLTSVFTALMCEHHEEGNAH